MNRKHIWKVASVFSLALLLCSMATAGTPTITTFDPTGSLYTYPIGINLEGTITGYYYDSSNAFHGFVRAHNAIITSFDAPDAGTGNQQGTAPFSINLEGAISGYYIDKNNLAHGFLRAPNGTITEFSAPGATTTGGAAGCAFSGSCPGTYGVNISLEGEVAGFYTDSNGVSHGFVRTQNGTITPFNAPGAGTEANQTPPQGTSTAGAIGINLWGAVTGNFADSHNLNHGYVRAPNGAITPFNAPGAGTGAGQGTFSSGLNALWVITGEYLDGNGVNHGYVRAPNGTIIPFNVSGAGSSSNNVPPQGTSPQSINLEGTITGAYADSSTVFHAFVRSPGGANTTFDVTGAGTGVGQGTFPASNNDFGVITGYYVDGSGFSHGFVRTQ